MAPAFNVFILNELCQHPSGYLTGCVSFSSRLICVLGITPNLVTNKRIIGYWNGTQSPKVVDTAFNNLKSRKLNKDNEDTCILLMKLDVSNCLCSELYLTSKSASPNEIHSVLIQFKPLDVLQSYIFTKTQSLEYVKRSERRKEPKDLSCEMCNDSLGEEVVVLLDSFLKQPPLSGEVALCKRQTLLGILGLFKRFIWSFSQLFIWTLSCLWQASSKMKLRDSLSISSLCQLLQEKSRRCCEVGSLKKGLVFKQFVVYNLTAQHVFDSLAGMIILYFILSLSLTDTIAFSTLDWADDVANRLNNLTQWLMGAPAGLKLNAELTTFLGYFYIYQIYIWTGYLVFMRSTMHWLILIGVWSGVFGLSFLLCFIKDVISLLTLHIYCFYVYAARIFNLQINALSSLWKLFRGKKWNVLRCRVDSAEYNTDQLFLGTLMFTVLLFLLPTTLLYYVVFTSLRLLTLISQGLLTQVITFINDMPVYTLILRILKPKLIAGATFFKIVNSGNASSTLVLNMETSQLPLKDVFELTAPYLCRPRKLRYSMKKLLSCIATGELLYPWMDVPSENDESPKKP